jgi:predicted nucleic acid-binding protein
LTYLIDTDRVADYMNGEPTAVTLLPQLQQDGIAISIVSFIELYDGVYGARDVATAEHNFRAFLRVAPVLGINRTVGREAARVRVDLRRRGLSVNHRALDIIIAATAMTHGLTLVTGNKRHFSDITGLTLY